MEFAPHITVATVIERDQRFLLVEEHIGDGPGLVLNQPAGHWEPGETLVEGAIRETLEETAWRCRIDALIGIYEYHPVSLPYSFIRFAYAATALEDTGAALDRGIERAVWLGLDEIRAQVKRHRSPMVLQCIDDYRAGHRIGLDRVQHLPPGP